MIKKAALVSPCGTYRYWLSRTFLDADVSDRRGTVNFLMLNPSTADAIVDDPTIKRCMSFAWNWGYRELMVTNLFAFRATDPKQLRWRADPIGPGNDGHILVAARLSMLTVLAYGAYGGFCGRDDAIRSLLGAGHALFHLGLTKRDGKPRHPLYVRADTPLELCI